MAAWSPKCSGSHTDPIFLEHCLLSAHAEPGNTHFSTGLRGYFISVFPGTPIMHVVHLSSVFRSVTRCLVTLTLVLFHMFLSDFLLLVPLIVSNNIYLTFSF